MTLITWSWIFMVFYVGLMLVIGYIASKKITLHTMAAWLHGEGPNPGSCAVMGEIVSVTLTFAVSRKTQPLPQEHIDAMFGAQA